MNVKCMIYKWEYIEDEDKDDGSIMILGFGRGEKNQSIVIRIHNFLPYIYILLITLDAKNFVDNVNKFLGNGKKIVKKYETSKRKLLRDYQRGERTFTKCYFKNTYHLKKVSDYILKNNKGYVYDNEIGPIEMFLASRNISICGWIEAICDKVSENIKISFIDDEYISDLLSIKPIEEDLVSKPLILSIDIEVYSSRHKVSKYSMPDPFRERDVIFMISLILQEYKNPSTMNKYLLYASKNIIEIDGVNKIRFDNEKELIDGYFKTILELDPDIIIGYNIMSFDFKYMYVRIRRKLNEIKNSSRIINDETKAVEIKWKSSAYGIKDCIDFYSIGRSSVDLFQYFMREFRSLQKYSLSSVSEHFLGENKLDLSPKDIFELYEKEDKLCLSKIGEYCIVDSILTMKLFDKLNIYEWLVEMSTITRVSFTDLITRGQQIRVRSQLYKTCYDEGVILDKEDTTSEAQYRGAIVMNPNPGIYFDCVVLDFSSLYPSIIIAYNICYSTMVKKKIENISEEDRKLYHIIDIEGKRKHIFLKSPKGIIPRLLERLIEKRKKVKELLKTETDKTMISVLKMRELATKIAANSVYGSFGAPDSKFLRSLASAESTTEMGRRCIENASDIIKTLSGAEVIYGDTDSCIVSCQGLEENNYEACKKFGLDLSRKVTTHFPPPIELKFENVFKTLFIITKKRYVATIQMDENNTKTMYKGVVVSRGDACKFLKDFYSKVLSMIMNNCDPCEIKEYVRDLLVDKLVRGRIDPNDLLIRKTLNSGYVNPNNPLMIYSTRLMNMGRQVSPGDKLEYVFVEVEEKLQGYKMFPLDIVMKDSIKIDYIYYIENQIMKPIDQILELANLEKFVYRILYSLKEMKRVGLFDIWLKSTNEDNQS